MPFAAALSAHPSAPDAVGEVVGRITEQLDGRPDLLVAFITGHFVPHAESIAAAIQTLLDPACFIGSSAVAVLEGAQGIEDAPGLAVWAAQLTGAVTPFHLQTIPNEGGYRIEGLPVGPAADAATMLLIPDPFSFPAAEFLAELRGTHPGMATVGGLASAARQAGGNRLIIGGRVVRHGAVGVLLDHPLATVVSQGCRPIGQPWTVTRSEGNVIFELAGRPALERLLEMIDTLTPEDRALAGQGLHCGIVADERKLDYVRGDFLIRGVLGADRKAGAVAVGERVPIGATVQFQVRDASTAGEDLRALLTAGPQGAAGALVFTCNGRGTFMFGTPNHDAEIIDDLLAVPSAGMFCAGEIGPVAGANALHGFTASVALFTG